ncbi:unnamed protein product [Boreogadus saida]
MTTAFLHFFFLASFCWVLTEAWQSYMAVTGKVRTRLIRKRFLCLGWVVAVTMACCLVKARAIHTRSSDWVRVGETVWAAAAGSKMVGGCTRVE